MAVAHSRGGNLSVTKNTLAQPYLGVTPLVTGSGNQANAEAKVTLTGTPSNIVYLCGLVVTGGGGSAEKIVLVTVAGLLGGTRSFCYAFRDDPQAVNEPLILHFDPPLPAADVNTPIVITCPAGGTGNLYNMVFAHGYSSTMSDPLPAAA